MTSSLQGIIIALLIAFFVGLLVGYSLVQRRRQQQSEALQLSQRQLAEMEQTYESRLRETTTQLRQDYEAEIAATIEHYQDQLSQKTVEMEQMYETRFQVLQQGDVPAATASGADAVDNDVLADIPLPSRPFQPVLVTDEFDQPAEVGDTPPPIAPTPLTQPELLHLKKQYEMRLKEAAQKLQKAYEKQLAHHVKQTRSDIHTEYETLLAQKLVDYEEQLATQKAELAAEYADRVSAVSAPPTVMEDDLLIATPSQIMGTGDETTVSLSSPGDAADAQAALGADEYSAAEIQAQVQATTNQMRADYERQLAERQATQQREFEQRLQALEAAHQTQIAEYQQKIDELSSELPSASSDIDDLFSDDLFDLGDEPSPKNAQDNDDDDFGPLDLSDISQLT